MVNPVVRYEVVCELWTQYGISWYEATLERRRIPVLETWGLLMIGNNRENDLISLRKTLKDTTESLWMMNLVLYGLRSGTGL